MIIICLHSSFPTLNIVPKRCSCIYTLCVYEFQIRYSGHLLNKVDTDVLEVQWVKIEKKPIILKHTSVLHIENGRLFNNVKAAVAKMFF